METKIVKITDLFDLTHDVRRYKLTKPDNYSFVPGQATEVAINKPDWTKEKRPFTFTCLPDEDHLEFAIKTYPEHKGVTHELYKLREGDELILHEVWGSIVYKGKGVFIAGGAGITPFISIIRHLEKNKEISGHLLIFANKTRADIIMEDEFNGLLNESFVNILSDEKAEGYFHGLITQDFLQEHIDNFDRKFYVCGPPPMMDSLLQQLTDLGVGEDSIIKEEF